jgi:hypothetical protein
MLIVCLKKTHRVTEPMIIEKAKSFYDKMEITDKCAFLMPGCKKNITSMKYGQCRCHLIIQSI